MSTNTLPYLEKAFHGQQFRKCYVRSVVLNTQFPKLNAERQIHCLTQRHETAGLADNCQILAVRSDICKIGQLSDRTTVSADNCQIRQLSDRTTVRSDNCQIGQLSVGQLSVGHGQLSEKTVSALKKL